ncbi:hypothetical protein ANCCAN_01324 [Ancylostoma caninum]|uniref:AB hydrolase-1 domain-containing protein n=1 Tax=Ancylostoma caninum TaxID=29170 RepID=A0A368HBI5_ANCCA|nr:hypothetical protein ANCCAN_01324 [Ancylostoma caninum]
MELLMCNGGMGDSWYHHSRYDLKNTVEYVIDVTKQEDIYYVGHSQGTLIMFARLAEDPEFNSKESFNLLQRSELSM